jgi:hypothetical protein
MPLALLSLRGLDSENFTFTFTLHKSTRSPAFLCDRHQESPQTLQVIENRMSKKIFGPEIGAV